MKTSQSVRALLALLLAVAALAASAAPNYKPVATALVIEHLQAATDPASDEEWKKFVETKKIVGQGLTAACTAALKVGREIIKDGTPAGSDYFAEILASSIGVAKAGVEPTRTASQPAAAAPAKPEEDETKTVEAADVTKLQRLRLDEKELKEKLQAADAARAALPESEEKARKEQEAKRTGIYHKLLAVTKEIRLLKTKHSLAVAQQELDAAQAAKTALADNAPTADKTKAEEQLAAAKLKLAAAATDDTNAKSGLALAQTATGDVDILQQARDLVGPLRKYGFSVSAGVGTTINDRDSATLSALFVRYNLNNARTLAKWYGQPRQGAGRRITDEERDDQWYARFGKSFTFCGPIAGRALGGEKIAFGAKLERPWIIGWGLGMGLGPEASSAFYLDLGATVSPTTGFTRSKPYVGMSFDAAIAASLFQTLGAPFGIAKPPAQN